MNRVVALRLEKWAIWLTLIAVIVLLRHLFPIFFLTFVLSYIGNSAVNALGRWIPRRKVNVAIVWLVFLAILTTVLILVIPRMLNEARMVARQYITTEAARQPGDEEGFLHREAREMVDTVIVSVADRRTFEDFRDSGAYNVIVERIDGALKRWSTRMTAEITLFANEAIMAVFHFILSIILSFLLIWDLPRTKERMRKFATGRTAEVYNEITPGLIAFSTMLGRAFEAQSVVAVVNASLTTVVFLALGLPSIALLAMIVFVCSYIPILGMIISTVPAAFLALKIGGITHVLWLVLAVAVIHAIEAYMLNPLIYGRHLKLHPLAVLIILMIAEHLFGMWGLLLGVPIAAFVVKHVLEGPAPATLVTEPVAVISPGDVTRDAR